MGMGQITVGAINPFPTLAAAKIERSSLMQLRME